MSSLKYYAGHLDEYIGLIPAAGFANRIAPLPCSKEIYPIGFVCTKSDIETRPKPIASYLMENMRAAGIEKIYMIIRDGKWDIPRYYLNWYHVDISLAYLVIKATPGVPYTINEAYPFIKDKKIVFGFPDILFNPKDAFKILIEKQNQLGADIVLGLFRTNTPEKMDMVELTSGGKIKKLIIKPKKSELKYTWIIAVWSPSFTEYIHNTIVSHTNKKKSPLVERELCIGEIIMKAVDSGLRAASVKFKNGSYIDIGTIEDLKKAISFMNV